MSNTKTSYAKLRDGTWGLRGLNLGQGDRVTVTKRSGQTKVESVGRTVWRGADGTTLAEIASAPRNYHGRNNYHQDSDYCGYPCPVTRRRCNATNGPCHDCQ